jgi:multidrug efflux pump subunit AcrB
MRLVLFALRRPTTIFVAVIAILVAAWFTVRRMPIDIFPDLGEPTIYIAQPYGGLDPAQMDGFATYYYEYHLLYVSGVKQIESRSVQGAALIKVSFYPGTNMSTALSEVVGYANRARAFMPPGAVPPFITRFDAGSVAIGQLVFSSQTRLPAEMQDFAINRVRPLFATLPGVSAPPPFGGAQRTILVRLDPEKLRQYRISPEEVIRALSQANVVAPSGVVRTGDLTRIASTNATIGGDLSELAGTPVRVGSGTPVYFRDIGSVESGSDVLTAYAHVNGKRTVYIPITKRADASTLAVMQKVREALPSFQKIVPEDVQVSVEFDQTPAVASALQNLLNEGALGALLTGLMVLIFLRDGRSALVVLATIPVSLLSSVVALWASGQTINLMTLAGLALAIGVLVDEATVEIENIHTELQKGTEAKEAILAACQRTAIPRLLSMISILAVFVPAFFMTGAGRQLFVPLALAVGFAMIASYLLSSTLVPVLAAKWLRPHEPRPEPAYRIAYRGLVQRIVPLRWVIAVVYLLICAAGLLWIPSKLGLEIFPVASAKQIRLRIFAPTGTRIERTEPLALRALQLIEATLGPKKVSLTTSFVGTHASSYPVNLIHLFTTGPHEAVLTVAIEPGVKVDTAVAQEAIRARLAKEMPQLKVLFEGGDIVSQVMSFGSPTPVRVMVVGPSLPADYQFAEKIQVELKKLAFLRDLQIQQPNDYPTLEMQINRDRAAQFGLTTMDVTRSLVAGTSSSRFIEPNYWRDPVSGNAFQVQVELPQNKVKSGDDIASLSLAKAGNTQPLAGDLITMKNGKTMGVIERFNGQKLISLVANLEGITLGRALPEVREAVKRAGEPPRGLSVQIGGQATPLQETIDGLQMGLWIATVSIFLLLAAAFQSFRLAVAVLLMSPAILCGSLLALCFTGSTINIQSYLGAIMALGIAIANAILYLSFAEAEGDIAIAGGARLRAILMTALAMLAGMLPMALGFGEGGEQTAPLGRAVIGGLIAATLATLFVLPAIYSIFRKEAKA